MKKPLLVVMAAGMGSRYGSLKQIDPVGPSGEVIIDYSVYDAVRAGFEKVIFIIKKDFEKEFKKAIGERFAGKAEVLYAYQELTDLPDGFDVPQNRQKPWGTSQAVLSARHLIDAPFAVINADDYYGPHAFKIMYDYLANLQNENEFAMVGYQIENTLTENGTVSRGVCEINENGLLQEVNERRKIMPTENGAKYTKDDGKSWTQIPKGTLVSMNLWGFTPYFLQEAEDGFALFLNTIAKKDPLCAEYYLPSVVSRLIDEKKATVKVLHSPDKWFGVTYKEDKPVVQKALLEKQQEGIYNNPLWKV